MGVVNRLVDTKIDVKFVAVNSDNKKLHIQSISPFEANFQIIYRPKNSANDQPKFIFQFNVPRHVISKVHSKNPDSIESNSHLEINMSQVRETLSKLMPNKSIDFHFEDKDNLTQLNSKLVQTIIQPGKKLPNQQTKKMNIVAGLDQQFNSTRDKHGNEIIDKKVLIDCNTLEYGNYLTPYHPIVKDIKTDLFLHFNQTVLRPDLTAKDNSKRLVYDNFEKKAQLEIFISIMD